MHELGYFQQREQMTGSLRPQCGDGSISKEAMGGGAEQPGSGKAAPGAGKKRLKGAVAELMKGMAAEGARPKKLVGSVEDAVQLAAAAFLEKKEKAASGRALEAAKEARKTKL